MISDTIGGRIRQARTEAGLSQKQLATRLAVTNKTLENWEEDRSEPRANKLVMLAGVLNIPSTWLLTGNAPKDMKRDFDFQETMGISQKLERAMAMQVAMASLLEEVSTDVSRLQNELDSELELEG
ncbi:helix-turn-helix domain-containing protein [Pelagibius sp. Alg239-R121]|uniref:helix-turn-helix domain-containing protein n=1 Tax=Pelagibius sp. Alg239-R121 TaxID=2993448 RepID=UPI0024A77179|nr:helix-turn-helix transcriptional regulator [Pelagibius sp. Alg239-R121]